MARNHLEEQLEAIRNTKSMLKWKSNVADDVDKREIEDKIFELTNEENKILKELKR